MSEETKEDSNFTTIITIIVVLFWLAVIGFILNSCMSPSESDNPSIYDEEFQKDMYGN